MPRSAPPLDVLLVSRPLTPTRRDGTAGLVRTLAEAGAAAGWRCAVLVPAGGAAPAGTQGRPAALPGSLERLAWQPLALASLGLAPGRSLRHYFFTPTPKVVGHLRRLHRLRSGPTVQTLCSTPPDDVALAPLIFADRVVALSEHTRQRLLDEGVDPARVAHIPPAVPPPEDSDRERRRQRVRHRLGLPEQTPLVLYMGDYDTEGAATAVAQALPRILASTPAHAVLACRPKGARHTAVSAAVETQLAQAPADVRSRVHRLGVIHWSAELAAAADVALFPAERLPDKMDLPLALLESLAAGVPAVVADTGPLADLVRGGAAVGVRRQDGSALVTQTTRLLLDPARHARAAAAARRWWTTEATPARLAEHHEQLYRDLLSPCGDRS